MDQDRQRGTVDSLNDAARDLREVWHRFGQARRVAALVSIWPIVAMFVVIFGIVFVILFGGVGSGIGGDIGSQPNLPPNIQPGGGGASLDYSIPFLGTNFPPLNKKSIISIITSRYPAAKTQYYDTIVTRAAQNGWNPAFVLTLWLEETGGSQFTKTSAGGAGYSPSSNGHLGCAPWEPQAIDQSLDCLFKNFTEPSYTFEDFMCIYGGDGFHKGPCTFNKDNPNFPGNIYKFYTLLVPSGPAAAVAVAPSSGSSDIVPVGQGGAKIASAAKQIAEKLVHSASTQAKQMGCDYGGTYGPSYHCWSEMKNYDQAADPNYLQCTEFGWASFDKAGFGQQISLIRNNNAYYWPDAAKKHASTFTVFSDPSQIKPGDIISMGTGGGGGTVAHVAVVIEKGYNTVKVGQASTQNPTETFYIENGKFVVHYPSSARCGTETSGCRPLFIRLTKL